MAPGDQVAVLEQMAVELIANGWIVVRPSSISPDLAGALGQAGRDTRVGLSRPICRKVTAEAIVRAVSAREQISVEALKGPRRDQRAATPRRLAYAACARLGWSNARIGVVFGRDHSTVWAGIRSLELERGAELEAEVRHILEAARRIEVRHGR